MQAEVDWSVSGLKPSSQLTFLNPLFTIESATFSLSLAVAKTIVSGLRESDLMY
jgi:hypothetical protein